MERQEIASVLGEIRQSLKKQFNDGVGTHESRLAQADAALVNAALFSDMLFDEEERETELAVRIMNDEASSPVAGRTKKDFFAVVARRAK